MRAGGKFPRNVASETAQDHELWDGLAEEMEPATLSIGVKRFAQHVTPRWSPALITVEMIFYCILSAFW